jgi:hypothetical protein
MAAVKRVLVLVLLIVPLLLSAQDSGTQVTKTRDGFQISQIIAFPSVPFAQRYDVEIEQYAGSGFVLFDTIHTEQNRIEVSLRAGSYRYRITVYNKMNLVEGVSDWQDFEVLAAEEPVVETYQPFYGLYYELADPAGRITVVGRDLYPESEFALVKRGAKYNWSSVMLANLRNVLLPGQVTVSEDHTRAELDFSRNSLKRGLYDIFVRNPGGLWATLGQVRVGYRKNNDFTVSFGYSPMIAAFDYDNAVYTGKRFIPYYYYSYYDPFGGVTLVPFFIPQQESRLSRFNPRGMYVRLGWLPVKTRIGNFGLEANVNFLEDHSMTVNTFVNIFNGFAGAHFDLLYQGVFSERWQLNARFGVGGGDKYHDRGNYDNDIPTVLLNFGTSAQFFIWKNLYAEAGIDFQYMLAVRHFMVWPAIGMGWQFGKWPEHAEVKSALKKGVDPSVPVTDIPRGEFTLSLGWSPMIPMYGMEYKRVYRDWWGIPTGREMTLLQPFNPLGAYVRMAYLPYRWGNNKLGAELEMYMLEHINRVEWTDNNHFRYLDLISHVQFGFLYQRVLTDSWNVNVRTGIGISNAYDFKYADDYVSFSVNAGISAQYFFWKNLYAEAGLDFVFSVTKVTHSMLRPGLGIGWQFRRDNETGLRLKTR